MKVYIITETDLNKLRNSLDSGADQDWWYETRLDEWEETLKELPAPNFDYTPNFDYKVCNNIAEHFVILELDPHKQEFQEFIEEGKFIKPIQPYYIKDGVIMEYDEVRAIFSAKNDKKQT